MLGHAEFDLPRLRNLHHPSPNVCQAAVEGDLEQGLLGKPRKIFTEIDMKGVMFTQEVPQAGPCTGDPPPQRARGSARNPGMRFSSQNLKSPLTHMATLHFSSTSSSPAAPLSTPAPAPAAPLSTSSPVDLFPRAVPASSSSGTASSIVALATMSEER